MKMEKQNDKETKETEKTFDIKPYMIKLSTILKKDAVMITFLILCMMFILYASNYNTNYDKVIHSYYKTYLKEQCICKDELPLANRIPITNLSNKGKNNLVITHESKD